MRKWLHGSVPHTPAWLRDWIHTIPHPDNNQNIERSKLSITDAANLQIAISENIWDLNSDTNSYMTRQNKTTAMGNESMRTGAWLAFNNLLILTIFTLPLGFESDQRMSIWNSMISFADWFGFEVWLPWPADVLTTYSPCHLVLVVLLYV